MKWLAMVLLVTGCDQTTDHARAYLTERGYAEIWCEGTGGEARCLADGIHFRCVTSKVDGCSSGGKHVACEAQEKEKAKP